MTACYLGGYAYITDHFVEGLWHWPALTDLCLTASAAINNRTIDQIAALGKLERLSICGSHITDESCARLAKGPAGKSLRVLHVSDCLRLRADGLAELCTLPHLQDLQMHRFLGVSAETQESEHHHLGRVVGAAPSLLRLDIALTGFTLAFLAVRFPPAYSTTLSDFAQGIDETRKDRPLTIYVDGCPRLAAADGNALSWAPAGTQITLITQPDHFPTQMVETTFDAKLIQKISMIAAGQNWPCVEEFLRAHLIEFLGIGHSASADAKTRPAHADGNTSKDAAPGSDGRGARAKETPMSLSMFDPSATELARSWRLSEHGRSTT